MAKTPNEIWRDYATDGVPASGLWNPPKADIREWATQIDIYSNASGYTLVFQTRASLYASLDHDANQMAWVVEDTNIAYNGIYQKLGASGTGSWVRVADLPFSYVNVVDDGLSTENAMSMTSSLPVTFGSMISVIVPLTNTSETVTIAFNGGDALAVKTASGGNPPVGSLIQDMVVVGYVDDVSLEFRLFTDIASAAIQTAAAASATSASASATSATASATLAGKWATEAEDVPVTSGLYSAYHWAQKAMAYVVGSIADAIHGATSKSAPAALDEFAIADSAASWALKKVTAESVMSGPQGYIYGLAMTNNATDATNDIDFAAGVAASDTSPFYRMTASALTKRLDATWTVGNNQGMLDTGTIADGTYNLFEIQRSDTLVVDFLASLSSSSPTMPSGYNRKRLIGYVVRSGGVNGRPVSSAVASAGGMTLISSVDISSAAQVDFTQFNSSLFDAYMLVFQNVTVATDNAALCVRTSSNGGSSYDSGASDYASTALFAVAGSYNPYSSTAAQGYFASPSSTDGIGNAAGEDGLSGSVLIPGPHLAKYTIMNVDTSYGRSQEGSYGRVLGNTVRRSSGVVNAIRIFASSGNLASGTINFYGLSAS